VRLLYKGRRLRIERPLKDVPLLQGPIAGIFKEEILIRHLNFLPGTAGKKPKAMQQMKI
jgi:hypothetical protein